MSHGSELHFLLEFNDALPEQIVRIHQILYGLTGMDDRSMIPATKMLPNGLERILSEDLG